jgi:hypothetical protein
VVVDEVVVVDDVVVDEDVVGGMVVVVERVAAVSVVGSATVPEQERPSHPTVANTTASRTSTMPARVSFIYRASPDRLCVLIGSIPQRPPGNDTCWRPPRVAY